jgi:imidazolonepropionase-like amidohydrolase
MRPFLRKSSVLLALLAAAAFARPPAAGADGDERNVAIRCGTLITGTGEEKRNVTVLIKDGKIDTIGEKVDLPHPCKVIDASKKVVMPGHIAMQSRLSLLSYSRNGSHADLRVADEFIPDPKAFEAALQAGFTTVELSPPDGGGIPGRAMIVRTADVGGGLVVDADGPVEVSMRSPAQDRRLLTDTLNGAKREIEKVEKAKADFEAKKKAAEEEKKKKEEEAKKTPPAPAPAPGPNPPGPSPAPSPAPSPKGDEPPKPEAGKPAEPKPPEEFKAPPIAPMLQPIVDVIQKKPGAFLLVRLGGGTTYLHYVEATRDFDVPHVLVADVTPMRGRPGPFNDVRGTDLHWAAKHFGENKELVVVAPHLSYSQGTVDMVDVPERLAAAGARVAMAPDGDDPEDFANFRYDVNEIVKGGMRRETALTAITKNAAEAIGQQARLGTVEKGKDGNLIVLTADPFDVQAVVDQVVIEGEVAWSREKKERS